MSLDSIGLTKEQYEASLNNLREAKINMDLRRIDRAIRFLNEDLRFRLSIQSETKRRVHKGAVYHNLGLCYLFEENADLNKAIRNFLLAYIEDYVSNAPFIEAAELGEAARILRIGLGIEPSFLMQIGLVVDQLEQTTDLNKILDPSEVLSSVCGEYRKEPLDNFDFVALCKSKAFSIPRRSTLPNALRREKRVFLGGNYTTQTANLLKMKEIVLRCDYEPVITDDYDIPDDDTRHYSLLLLHSCKYAIFDVTVAGGQYVEIERAGDYGIDPLLVFSADSVSREKPLTSGLKMLGRDNLRAYRDMETDLEPLIREYLR